jgi:hypothetical protein
MKKLAIFGDSWAEIKPMKNWNGWSRQLQKEYPEGECDVYAVGGASLSFIFRKFLENQLNYEKIIFIVTGLHRWSFPEGTGPHGRPFNPSKYNNQSFDHWASASHTIWTKDNFSVENNLAVKIENYLVDMSKPAETFVADTHMAIINYIKNIRPDAIIVPAFPDKNLWYTGEYKWCLADISNNEFINWSTSTAFFHDKRCNHLTRPSNKWVLQHMKARLNGTFIEWDKTSTPGYLNEKDFKMEIDNYE